VQLTLLLGTVPSEVGEPKVQCTVSTTVPGGCSTVSVALVNARSVMSSVHCGFGQSGAPGMGVTGWSVTTSKATFPFLISDSGIARDHPDLQAKPSNDAPDRMTPKNSEVDRPDNVAISGRTRERTSMRAGEIA
jgi:hypothetical protein